MIAWARSLEALLFKFYIPTLVNADSGSKAIYSYESSGRFKIIYEESPPPVSMLLPVGFIWLGAPYPDITPFSSWFVVLVWFWRAWRACIPFTCSWNYFAHSDWYLSISCDVSLFILLSLHLKGYGIPYTAYIRS